MSIGEIRVLRIARAECGPLLKWWVQELRGLVEGLLERLAPRLAKRLVIRFGEEVATACAPRNRPRAVNFEFPRDERGQWPERLDEFGPRGEYRGARATFVLAPREVFKFDLNLPELAERNLEQVIQLHLEREWPASRDRYAVDYWIVRRLRPSGMIKVQVLVVRHEQLERLRALAQSWGLRPTRIAAAGESGRMLGDFLPRRFRLRPVRVEALAPLERRLAITAAALALALVVVISGQWAYERLVVGAALDRASRHATVATRLAHELSRQSLPARQLLRISNTPDALDILLALTRSIPANAWVYKLDVSAPGAGSPGIRLTAFAPAAAALAGILQKTHRFGSVHLVWALSDGTGSGLDQLELTASGSASDSAQQMSDGPTP